MVLFTYDRRKPWFYHLLLVDAGEELMPVEHRLPLIPLLLRVIKQDELPA